MKLTDQYAHLVEMVAQARVLAALSDNASVSHQAEKIKGIGVVMAGDLGVGERDFSGDTVKRYMQLIEGVR